MAAVLTYAVILAGAGQFVGTSTAHSSSQNSASSYQRAKKIVYSIFPSDTEAAALRVVGCETGGTYNEWSYNSSGASGYFQILQGNAGRRLYDAPTWDSRSKLGIVIPSGHALFLPWTNTKVAYYLSKGGHDWHEWTCRP
jgi:hypothetical protein